MKSFTTFIKQQYLALQSILYFDCGLFKNICQGKYNMTPQQIEKFEIEQNVIKQDQEKTYMQNDQEIQLIKKYQNDPDSDEGRQAMEKLVQNKMPLIHSKVSKHLITHPNQASHRQDLVQEGALALMKAIETFDINSKNIFNAYAIRYITGAILNAYNPVRQKSVVDGKVDDNGSVTTMTSVDAPVSGSKGDFADKDMTVGDSIPDQNASTPGEEDLTDQRLALIRDWIKQLPEKQAKAVQMYFPKGGQQPKTYQEIGKAIGMTKMGAKKVIDRVLLKLKEKTKNFKD